MIECAWADFKQFITSRSLSIQYVSVGDNYHLRGFDGYFSLSCTIPKDPAHGDTSDFLANFISNSNKRISQIDSEGSSLVRNKTTRTGWHYEPRSIDFITSTLGSLYNRKHDGNAIDTGTDYGDCTMSFFNSSGSNITSEPQSVLDTDCVKTQIDWQSTYEIDIIGADITILNPPEPPDRAYLWVVVAPDIPEAYGGSIPFASGGLNLCLLNKQNTFYIDGRGVKTFAYDPVYNSNKIRAIVKHSPGAKLLMQINVWKFNQ